MPHQTFKRFTVFTSLFLSVLLGDNRIIHGRVVDLHSGAPVVGAEIYAKTGGSITDRRGNFSFAPGNSDSLILRCMGYETRHLAVAELTPVLTMIPAVLQGQSIDISANRVIPGISPVAYSIMDREQIRQHYTVEDVPMILSAEPGVYAYSESGNGTGYSYVSIRGFDQSRIAVMLDNVPLNDNESHQVYWVDHGDILSNAQDVEIQRGVGGSLYGASAFGGSINIKTGIQSERETLELGLLVGSYQTGKYRFQYNSGQRLGSNLSLLVRGSLLNSDGYRVDSRSEQQSLMLGLEYRSTRMINRLRANLGKEFSVLQWDGVSREYLDDPELRRQKMSWTNPFTDNYFQQIYSLNTRIFLSDHTTLRNVLYWVKGDGYYEVKKSDCDAYSYNLDVRDRYADSLEQTLTTDLTRRKWINNDYVGVTPVWTYESHRWRSDLGLELRAYQGDHFGEVMALSDSTLAADLLEPYTYYSYVGRKRLITGFGHLLLRPVSRLSLSMDLRVQKIMWTLDQQAIIHAAGNYLKANWLFINPQLGCNYELNEHLHLFASVGSAQHEPADAQIIQADDVWSVPESAASEGVINTELGLNWYQARWRFSANLYRIDYQNELLSDIYDFQDGSFRMQTADLTIHQGLEFDFSSDLSSALRVSLNGSFSQNEFTSPEYSGKVLPNVPGRLMNAWLQYAPGKNFSLSLGLKYVGRQYIDNANTGELAIPAYLLADSGLNLSFATMNIQLKVNNLLNTRYATYGYSYYGGYYWPGADRNYSMSFSYTF